jgi:hypothetical protein
MKTKTAREPRAASTAVPLFQQALRSAIGDAP